MQRQIGLALAAMLALAPAAPLFAQGAPKPSGTGVMMPDKRMRVGKLIGTTVYDAHSEAIGKVVDVLVKPDGSAPMAVLSVGDYVGGGPKMVAVPLGTIDAAGPQAVMPEATKESLRAMPLFLFPPSDSGSG